MNATPSILPRSNNSWHRYDPDSEIAIVFVHGFFSSSDKCWKSSAGVFWPDLLSSDDRIPVASIFLGGYVTNLTSGSYGVADCAAELLGALKRQDAHGRQPPVAFPELVFICHSLGGIVVREMLSSYPEEFNLKRIGLVLLASPSLGSDYASNFLSIARFYKNRVGRQLAFETGYLEDLDRRFSRYIQNRSDNSFVGAEAIELYAPFANRFLPGFAPIVTTASAGRYFADRRKIAANHTTIVKPDSVNHDAHSFVVDFFQHLFAKSHSTSRAPLAPSAPVNCSRPSDVLFDVYDSSHEPFYVERVLDGTLNRAIDIQNIWISGRSGLGKTCCLQRLALARGRRIDICLSQMGPHACRQTLIRELFETFQQMGLGLDDNIEDGFQSLVRSLARLADEPLTLSIDEVPSGSECSSTDELLSLLNDLITTLKQKSSHRNVRITVSSLHPPNIDAVRTGSKIHEHFSFHVIEPWSSGELNELCSRVTIALPEINRQSTDLASLIEGADGSPRLIKLYFRMIYSRPQLRSQHIEVLELAQQQLGMDLIP